MTLPPSMDVKTAPVIGKRLSKRLKAKGGGANQAAAQALAFLAAAAASNGNNCNIVGGNKASTAAFGKQLLQGLVSKSLLRGAAASSGLSITTHLPLPSLPCLALLLQLTQANNRSATAKSFMHHPIQVKPSDINDNRNERKLFIGMLSKKCNENEVRLMFAPFGTIEECTVLRDANGHSKGCAFVTYASRQCAINAIKAMNHSQTMEGCSGPMVVKLADTQKEKEQKRQQQMMASLLNVANLAALTPSHYLAPATSSGTFTNLPQLTSGVSSLSVQQQLAALAQVQVQANTTNSGLSSLGLHGVTSGTGGLSHQNSGTDLQSLATLASLAGINPMILQNLAVLAAANGAQRMPAAGVSISGRNSSCSSGGSSGVLSSMNGNVSVGVNLNKNCFSSMGTTGLGTAGLSSGNGGAVTNALDALTPPAYSHIQPYSGLAGALNQVGLQQTQDVVGKRIEGPEGANLFIYHLPQELTDSDLAQTFMPFGTVISAKVFIDKRTNLSKCFGFVSYDNPLSAQAAIQAMNGFQISTKRLKVQLKRPKDATKPY